MALAILLTALASIYLTLSASRALNYLGEPERLRTAMLSLGLWGPASVVVLMVLAVVVSPVPSAPIALAAGTAYGHVLTGAEMGALAAFVIARLAGKAAVERWLARSWCNDLTKFSTSCRTSVSAQGYKRRRFRT
jgi:uncharacterized membrane protein YdjX (TVP38/TMEM64 family)